MTSQKCCKVCKNAKSIVTTLEPYGFRCPEMQYVCHLFLTLLWAPSDFFAIIPNFISTQGDVTHWLCFLLRGSRWRGLVWGWELTCLSRLSHDDGTFTQGKLPQIIYYIYYILYIIYYILYIIYYILYIIYYILYIICYILYIIYYILYIIYYSEKLAPPTWGSY